MITLVLFIFVITLLLRFPIAFALGISCLVYILVADIPLIVIPMKLYSGIDVFVLLSVPGFILAGNLMNEGGLTAKIISFCNHLFGHIRGGLALTNVGASMLFAGISGTAVSDTASIGSVMIPAMTKDGYSKEFASALTAASSTVGPIIPPSIPMIIAATLSGMSVGKLFLASAIPGFILGISFMFVTYFISVKRNYPKHPRSSFVQVAKGFVETFWAMLMIFIILFGIIGGVFTPTEASIVAVLYALCIGIFIYKKLNIKNIQQVIFDSMKTTASLMILIGFANLFGWILITEKLPFYITEQLMVFGDNKIIVLLLINIILLFIGSFMETIAALLILFPTLLKVAVTVGVDPIHFAVIVVLNLIIGLTTPPVGVCLFVASGIGKVPMGKISIEIIPFLCVSLFVLLLVTFIPDLSLILPSLFSE